MLWLFHHIFGQCHIMFSKILIKSWNRGRPSHPCWGKFKLFPIIRNGGLPLWCHHFCWEDRSGGQPEWTCLYTKLLGRAKKTTYTFFSFFVLHLGTRATVLSNRLTFVLGRSSITATSFLKDPLVNMATFSTQYLTLLQRTNRVSQKRSDFHNAAKA